MRRRRRRRVWIEFWSSRWQTVPACVSAGSDWDQVKLELGHSDSRVFNPKRKENLLAQADSSTTMAEEQTCIRELLQDR